MTLTEWWELQPVPNFDPFFDHVAHGDDDHRAWLKAEIEKYRSGLWWDI